jgi:endonuclease/exonuclease/phosphatase family metal-dependent hydrolase
VKLPPGRFVAGTTQTIFGEIKVIGVCIPWQSAHTTTGNKNRRNWEDHETYLIHLAPLLTIQGSPLIVAGDFNQRIPQGRQPQRIFKALTETFKNLSVSTIQSEAPALIDHITHTQNLKAERLSIITDTDQLGKLSDHRGVIVNFTLK